MALLGEAYENEEDVDGEDEGNEDEPEDTDDEKEEHYTNDEADDDENDEGLRGTRVTFKLDQVVVPGRHVPYHCKENSVSGHRARNTCKHHYFTCLFYRLLLM